MAVLLQSENQSLMYLKVGKKHQSNLRKGDKRSQHGGQGKFQKYAEGSLTLFKRHSGWVGGCLCVCVYPSSWDQTMELEEKTDILEKLNEFYPQNQLGRLSTILVTHPPLNISPFLCEIC